MYSDKIVICRAAGGFVGYAGALLQALARITANDFDNDYALRTPLASREKFAKLVDEDQLIWHTYGLRHPEEIGLDVRAEIFLNALGFEFRDFELREGGVVWSRDFNRSVCFAHGHGSNNLALRLLQIQRKGVQPDRCREETYVFSNPGLERFLF